MKKIIIRAMKFVANEMRKVIGEVIKNKNLIVNSYLYDMTTTLRNDLKIIHRYEHQYVIGTEKGGIICKINRHRPIDVLDMKRFQKIKISLMRIGETPQHAFNNIDRLFKSAEDRAGGRKPVSVTIRR